MAFQKDNFEFYERTSMKEEIHQLITSDEKEARRNKDENK